MNLRGRGPVVVVGRGDRELGVERDLLDLGGAPAEATRDTFCAIVKSQARGFSGGRPLRVRRRRSGSDLGDVLGLVRVADVVQDEVVDVTPMRRGPALEGAIGSATRLSDAAMAIV